MATDCMVSMRNRTLSKTIDISDKVFEWLKISSRQLDCTHSEVIELWHDEVFARRRDCITDADFGR